VKLLPYTDFHNDLISEKLDIGQDYVNWVQGGNRFGKFSENSYFRDESFSFCNYPYVLDSFLKSRILHVESVVQQRRQRMVKKFPRIFQRQIQFFFAPQIFLILKKIFLQENSEKFPIRLHSSNL
jgi:hypothetical protein